MDLLTQIGQTGGREAERIASEAEAEARARLARAEQEIAAQADAYREGERHRIEQEQRLVVSRARAQARGVFLKAKGRAADRLFEILLRETADVRGDPARYREFLERCLREVEREIHGALILHVDPSDAAVVNELVRGTPHQVGDPIKTRGGFLATNAGGDLVVDERLETRIANLRQRARTELGAALFGRATPA